MIFGYENSIKIQEYMKGLYRYPNKMIGRNVPTNLHDQKTNILVFAAHPDDEVLGLSATLQRYKKVGKRVTVVYVTNGSSRDQESWQRGKKSSESISMLRYKEGVQALSFIHILPKDILCLGFPDAGTQRYLKDIATDVQLLLEKLKPDKVYVHCIEGGHNDHDLVSLVVKSVCFNLNYQDVYEWAEYSQLYPLGTKEMGFLPSLSHHKEEKIKIKLSENELIYKKRMLACHKSQDVEDIFTQGEIFRKADRTNLREELIAYSQVIKEDWSYLVERFLNYMAIKKK